MDKDEAASIITIKANIDATVKEIREALTETQVQIFKKTCLGHWLDISLKRNNQLLIHTLLTCMVDSVANELSFLVSGKRIRFRRQEFCLVTGLRFRSNMYMKEWVKDMAKNPFRNRVFPYIEAKSDKLSDVIVIFDKMRGKSLVLEDNDAVKICLLVLFQHGFLGHQMSHNISNEKLIDALNKRQVNHDDKREKGEEIRYTLTRFVYAFMDRGGLLGAHGGVLIGELIWCGELMTTVSTLEGTVTALTLESRLLALDGDERDFGVVSDGDIPAYMSPRPSYTSSASTSQKSLPLANRRKLRVRRTTLKLKSPMRCYLHTKDEAKDVTKDVANDTISVHMTTTEKLKDTIHIDAAAQYTFCTEDELQFIGMEKSDKPNYDLPDLSKIKRNKYPIYNTFEKKKTDCYLDCLSKGRTCEPSFWEILYPGDGKAEYIDEGKLDGLHINAFIELIMRKRPRNAQWTLRLSEIVAFHIESHKLMSMVSVVDALRTTIDGTNPRTFPFASAILLTCV
uniref:Phospholipase-like protein n=1 Tax=Tanacetum cinerariifolium TaxID=118510 RepID=A0A6L2P472_TANCI|nr:phospholipase-like protein [Tanacetum cinerariifolium]